MDLSAPLVAIATAIESFFRSIVQFFEKLLIVYPIETVSRLIRRLDPRVYSRALRIVQVTQGYQPKKNDAFFILVLYSKGPTAQFLTNIIDAIANSPHNLVVVSNLPLPPLLKAQLTEKCLVLIERKNIGRDFGAYQDGIQHVREHFTKIDRIVLINDSLFFFRRSLDKLVADLTAPYDFIGVTETHELHYHAQSFALSFGSAVINNPNFIKFWSTFRPLGTRHWTIHRGEVRLTRQMTKAGFRPHILFPAAHLLDPLQRRPVRDAVESVRLLPRSARKKLYGSFLSSIGEKTSDAAVNTLEAVAYGVRRTSMGGHVDGESKMLQINNQAASMGEWSLGILPEHIVSEISRRNQMHYGAFLFMKHLGMPILKRDIFFRGLYSLEEVHQILTEFGEPLRDEILADLRRTGSGETLGGLRGVLYRHGVL
jgi:hypothetical protein